MASRPVTGGAGFLGSHLCDELLRRGNRVICVDNFETGYLANISHIRVPEFVHMHTDIIGQLFVDEPIDVIYHFASPASPIDYPVRDGLARTVDQSLSGNDVLVLALRTAKSRRRARSPASGTSWASMMPTRDQLDR